MADKFQHILCPFDFCTFVLISVYVFTLNSKAPLGKDLQPM
jgi:hypothetical protein